MATSARTLRAAATPGGGGDGSTDGGADGRGGRWGGGRFDEKCNMDR